MTKSLVLATALIALTVSTSFAQRGSLTLGWNNCRAHGGGIQNMTFACDTNGGSGPLLVGAFIPSASANLNSLNSALLYVDIYQVVAPTLNPWWQFTDPPVTGCRPLSTWSLDMANAAGAMCDRSYWREVGLPASLARWFYPSFQNNHGTLRMLVAVDPQIATTTPQIGVGAESHVFGARLGLQNSTGSGSCAGCLNPAYLFFGEADFFQTNGDNFVIDQIGPQNYPNFGPKCATWQVVNPSTGCPSDPDPVHNASWGAIKSLYR